jgi:hypothetical protein
MTINQGVINKKLSFNDSATPLLLLLQDTSYVENEKITKMEVGQADY